jgi:DNA polymerase-3 subunit alpha
MGIEVKPPDVATSDLEFTVEGAHVRFGLSAIKGVGDAAMRTLLEARAAGGAPRSLHELCAAVDPRLVNKRVLEALIQSGALDSFGARRSQLAAAADTALDWGQKQRADREAGQGSLFGGGPAAAEVPPRLPELPDWDERTRLTAEKATLGFYVTGHPLESHRELLGTFATHATAELREVQPGTEVAVGGIIGGLRRRKSKRGEWWASFSIEDLQGQIEVLLFPKAYQTCHEHLADDRAVLIGGRVETDEDRPRLLADEVCPLDELRERKADAVQVRLDASALDDETVARLRQAIEAHRGEARLYFEIAQPGAFRLVAQAEAAYRVTPSPRLTEALETLVGRDRVRYRAVARSRA